MRREHQGPDTGQPHATPPDDAALWARIAADDADAFGLLFERHGARIHGYALRRTGDVAAAEDIAAVVFLEAWRRRHEVVLDQASALPWLYGVAANVIRRWHRTRRRHGAALARLAQLPSPTTTPVERHAEAVAEAAAVMARIRHLPARERDVLVLSVWEGLSHAEIAVALDTTVGTVKSRLHRARARLGTVDSGGGGTGTAAGTAPPVIADRPPTSPAPVASVDPLPAPTPRTKEP
ncbi:MAG TPA: sigma-70 family RNA polymerase sigma factor [Aquihabitans sp.]|nr:sigma-70 family RNA polymerase sigma factor [Aquihabitans sp.]